MAYSSTDYQKLYESEQQKVKNQYQTARDSLAQQQSALPIQYQGQRDAVSAQGYQTAHTLDETNAQRGLFNSGSARTDLARNAATIGNGINTLNSQQSQAAQSLSNSLNQLNAQEATDISGLQGQQAQNERNYALQEAGLTGQYNGAPTLAAQTQTNNNAYNNALLAQNTAQSTYGNQLALLQALQNYNLGIGQVTDSLPQISGYNYGDALKTLLAQLRT